ncbi:hypothetical protein CUREO4125_00390 [Campylobacter ureolyticus]|uniref:hypothetical protein n=1 Tax=Campylobacter ureolyticus TaxID=827 RepID=UPI00215AFA66|nr:hypothetical protein [Campylobacter ureolyticus]MCR8698849.1 hypothetical protein [Campylobacter ureolyticus]
MLDNIIVVLVFIAIFSVVIAIIFAFIAWSLATVYNFLSLFDRPYKEPKHREPIYEKPEQDEPEQKPLNTKL